MKSDDFRLFRTFEHPCGYFAQRTAQNLVIDPADARLPQVYGAALAAGFRRAGGHVYQPDCAACRACIAARIPVAAFHANRSQRRCRARNADLRVTIAPARLDEEHFALYARYLDTRHAGGGMDHPQPEDFSRFLFNAWSSTHFLDMRDGERLLASAVTDRTSTGLSAVYTFFDPGEDARGLGTYAILQQVEWARSLGVPHLYLGYWIRGHPKMDYKSRFAPLELLGTGGWSRLQSLAWKPKG